MDLDVLLTSANVMQSSIIFITLTANIPQWITIHSKKTSENISLSSWVMWLMASFFGFFYAVTNFVAYSNGLALVMTSFVSLVCNAYTIAIIIKYRQRTEQEQIFKPNRNLLAVTLNISES